jgi:hypothetical protein
MVKKKLVLIVLLLIIGIPLITTYFLLLPNPTKKGWSGAIIVDTTWEGEILVSGDIIVAPWATLTVKPGTIVKVMAGHDDFNFVEMDEGVIDDLMTNDPVYDPRTPTGNFHKNHIGILVKGNIICKGTPEAPILFTSDAVQKQYYDWFGFSILNGQFEYTTVEYCVSGIYSDNGWGDVSIDHCNIRHVWAAGIGFMEPKTYDNTLARVTHTSIEDCGHEGIDTHSAGTVEIMYNTIKSSQVGLNLRDDHVSVAGHFQNNNIRHNVIVDCNLPVLIAGGNTFITQCVLNAQQQNNSRWSFGDFTMPVVGINPSAILMAPELSGSLILANSIIYDSPLGISISNPQSTFQSGFLLFDNVETPSQPMVNLGAGVLYTSAGFVDAANGDFHLSSSSEAKGAGNPVDGSPDLGVYGGETAQAILGWMA